MGSMTATGNSGGRRGSESGSSVAGVATLLASTTTPVSTSSGLLAESSSDVANVFLRRDLSFLKCFLTFRCFDKILLGCLSAVHNLSNTEANFFGFDGLSRLLTTVVLKMRGCSDEL